MIVLIAALHALPPLIGAWLFGKKGWLIGMAIGVICSLIFGGLIYTPIDLVGVFGGAFFGFHILLDRGEIER